jgi:hypothetical protein
LAAVATIAPYGSWRSPITTDLVASEGSVSFGWLDVSDEGIYWTESRPEEQGRTALVLQPHDGAAVDVVPAGFNVRTRVHEYGGGAWFRDGRTVFCSSFDDSRLYRIDAPGEQPRPITPEPNAPHALRYTDGRVFAEGRLIVCGAGDRMMLVALAVARAGLGHVIVEMSRAVARIKEIFDESPR